MKIRLIRVKIKNKLETAQQNRGTNIWPNFVFDSASKKLDGKYPKL